MAHHRTDCITCHAAIYHPPIWGDDRDRDKFEFVEFKADGGFVYRIKDDLRHVIILSRTGDHVIATCLPRDRLDEAIQEMNILIYMDVQPLALA